MAENVAGTNRLWTIMLYMSGDNNLSSEIVRAINDLEASLPKDDTAAVLPPEQIAITIQYDPLSSCCDTLLYAIPLPAGTTAAVHPVPIPLPGNLLGKVEDENSANPKVLADFIERSVTTFPSKYRMLILSGHGSGAVGDFLGDRNAGGFQPGSLSIPGLGSALRLARSRLGARLRADDDGHRRLVHVLGMDSCLMSMAEVGFEVREDVQFLVGSEGFAPNAGWPYGRMLAAFGKRMGGGEEPGPIDVAGKIVGEFLAHYDDYLPAGMSVDIAACDLTKADALAAAVRDLSAAMVAGLCDAGSGDAIRDSLILMHWRTQSFKFEQYTDLRDFCEELQKEAARHKWERHHEAIANACSDVIREVNDVVDGRQGHVGVEFQYAHGLSVYFPWSLPIVTERREIEAYRRLEFAGASRWAAFLETYLDRTIRPARDVAGRSQEVEAGDATVFPSAPFRNAEGYNRNAEGYNRNAEGYNKFGFGLGSRLPWSTKNPPQTVRVPRARRDGTRSGSGDVNCSAPIVSAAPTRRQVVALGPGAHAADRPRRRTKR